MDFSNLINKISTEIQTEPQKEETITQSSSENVSIFHNDENTNFQNSGDENILSSEFEELSNFIYNSTEEKTEESSLQEKTIPEESISEEKNKEVEIPNNLEIYIEETFNNALENNDIATTVDEEEIVNLITKQDKSTSKTSINEIINNFINNFLDRYNNDKDNSGKINISESQTIYNAQSEEEIRNNISTYENELNIAKKGISSILDNSNESLQSIKSEVNEKYTNYYNKLNELDPTMAQELNEHVENVKQLEEKRDKKIQEFFDKEIEVNEAKNQYDCCFHKATEVFNTKLNVENSLNEVNTLLENTTDESERKNLEAQKKYLEMEHQKLDAEYRELEEKEKQTKAEYYSKLEELDAINAEMNLAEEELQFAKTNKENYEQSIVRKYPETKSVQSSYNEAKDIYEQTRCDKLLEYINNFDTAQLNKNQANIELERRSAEENSKRIERNIDAMKKYDSTAGNNIFSSSKNIVKDNQTSTGYCLRDVHYALSTAYRGNQTPLPVGFSSAHQTAEALRGNISGYEDIASNFVEIEINDPNDLANLPEGAVVVWDNSQKHPYGHVSISDGQGNEYSDYKGTQMTNYGTKCYVFIPVS